MKNAFAEKLQYLLRLTNTKNSILAKAVQYDLSYISKWLSGKMLPSEKNIDEVISRIASCLLQADPEKLMSEYDCSEADIKDFLLKDLHHAYDQCREKSVDNSIQALQPVTSVITQIQEQLTRADSVCAMVDLFSLSHENRLLLADIKDGRFIQKIQPKQYSMVIHIDSKDCVYDSIFLIHMLTSLSSLPFYLYNSPFSSGKLLYGIDKEAYSAFLLPDNKDCLAVGHFDAGEKIRQQIQTFTNQENLIFRHSTMDDMIANREYIQTLITSNVRWILGHATELLLPQDVFDEIVAGMPREEEYRRLYLLSQVVLSNPNTRLMAYESALSELVVTGILDFYNQPVKLTSDQILRCLDYYISLFEMGAQLKLIKGGFSTDFRYITNPCLFLSDTVCYIRLENQRYENNILLFNSREIKKLFDSFFETVWTKREDVVASDPATIIDKLKHYRSTAEVLLHT